MRMESGALIIQNRRLGAALWRAKEALQFYSDQKHFDTPDGKTRIIDNGGEAEDALQEIESILRG